MPRSLELFGRAGGGLWKRKYSESGGLREWSACFTQHKDPSSTLRNQIVRCDGVGL